MASRKKIVGSIAGAVLIFSALVGTIVVLERPSIAVGASINSLPTPDYLVSSASIGTRKDERSSGLVLKHDVLKLSRVSKPKGLMLRGDTWIYTETRELRQKLDDVLEGRVPVPNGVEAMFALGRLAHATVVKLDHTGHVRSVEDLRGTFVAFTMDQQE